MQAEEIGSSIRYLYFQVFFSSTIHVDRFEFAALYMLQDRLARYPEQVSGFEHRDIGSIQPKFRS
ncbi:hypothetical protein NB231_13671 [Nitrococcus mobilis Nb-231]|uniref:Uncharacterized protein n=1 Tax=Nitrococcus mobilis Nb-231 TaxID=314278 RepID=A4BVG7_9GAMM|nr:hypothetical protein NB231_13671 [Nitrococcus mobilis Nb-231]